MKVYLFPPVSQSGALIDHHQCLNHLLQRSCGILVYVLFIIIVVIVLILLFDYQRKQIYFMDVSCPAYINVLFEEEEKSLNCRDLASDFPKMYGMSVIIIPVVL